MDDPEATIRDTISRMAANNGEPHPHHITYVATTRGAAGRELSRNTVMRDADRAVHAIVAQGQFIGYVAKVGRHDAPLPTGRYLQAVVDAATGNVVSWGITDRQVDLAALGTPVELADTTSGSQ